MDFTKMQGAANDFVVIDARNIEHNWAELAIAMCNRHLGIGADSLLLLKSSDRADFLMLTFDADGYESETCGNGIRCIARYALEKGLAKPDDDVITIETAAAVSRVTFEKSGGEIIKLWANMGKPHFSAENIPVKIEAGKARVVDINNMINYNIEVGGIDVSLNLVSMGNPHAVLFIQKPVSDFPLTDIGPVVERLPVFPRRMNFEVARVIDDTHLEARVWERGVGETFACGSGACAISVASRLLGYTGSKADIEMPGGTLNTEWNGNGEVVLGGPAATVFEGKWPD